MQLDDGANTAYVLIWEPNGFDHLNFYWNIEGDILGFAERIYEHDAIGSKITIGTPDPTWDGDQLRIFIYNEENGLSTERRWTIEVSEGN